MCARDDSAARGTHAFPLVWRPADMVLWWSSFQRAAAAGSDDGGDDGGDADEGSTAVPPPRVPAVNRTAW